MDNFEVDPYQLTGKTVDDVMTDIENCLLSLRSSFSGSTAPSNPVAGLLWKNSETKVLSVYTGTTWVALVDADNSRLPHTLKVQTESLDDECVTEPKLGLLSVYNKHIQIGTIGHQRLASGCVTHAKLADYCVESDNVIAFGAGTYSITGNQFAKGTVTNPTSWTEVAKFAFGPTGIIRIRVGYLNSTVGATSQYRIKRDGVVQTTSGTFANTTAAYSSHNVTVATNGQTVSLEVLTSGLSTSVTAGMLGCVDASKVLLAGVSYDTIDLTD